MDPETYANLLTVMQMAQQGDPHAQEMMITVMGSLVQKKKPNTAALADLAKNGKNKVEITGTVWDSIKPTQPNYIGSVIPRSFEMILPATEHIAEYTASKTVTHTPEAVKLAGQEQLNSFQSAVNSATKNNIHIIK